MLNWEYISPQPDILPVHFFVASFKLKYTDFINASSVGYSDFVFVYFLSCLFRLSIGFVVYISFLIFVSYLKYVVNSFQLLLHEFITAIYFFPHFSSRTSSLFSACSNVGALYISFRSAEDSLTSL